MFYFRGIQLNTSSNPPPPFPTSKKIGCRWAKPNHFSSIYIIFPYQDGQEGVSEERYGSVEKGQFFNFNSYSLYLLTQSNKHLLPQNINA